MSLSFNEYQSLSPVQKLQGLGLTKLKILCNNHKLKYTRNFTKNDFIKLLTPKISNSDFPVKAENDEDKKLLEEAKNFSTEWKKMPQSQRLNKCGLLKLRHLADERHIKYDEFVNLGDEDLKKYIVEELLKTDVFK